MLESLVTARPFLFLLLIIDNSDYDLKHFQGFVCFHCQKIILFQNIPDILKYPERVFSKMSAGSILLLLPETFFVVGVVFGH